MHSTLTSVSSNVAHDLKLINYGGGVVQFRIPSHWIEAYEEEGGGTFCEPHPDAGVLRVNILTYRMSEPLGEAEARALLMGMGQARLEPVITHEDGNLSAAAWDVADEDGELLAIRCWYVVNRLPPNEIRIAFFTFTMLEPQKDEEVFIEEVAMLDREVRSCRFSEEVGE